MKAAALVPGLQDGIAALGAWQKLVAGIMDDIAAYLAALVLLHMAPVAWAGEAAAAS